MSDPSTHSESVSITSSDQDGETTSHTQVVEDGETVVDETHHGGSATS